MYRACARTKWPATARLTPRHIPHRHDIDATPLDERSSSAFRCHALCISVARERSTYLAITPIYLSASHYTPNAEAPRVAPAPLAPRHHAAVIAFIGQVLVGSSSMDSGAAAPRRTTRCCRTPGLQRKRARDDAAKCMLRTTPRHFSSRRFYAAHRQIHRLRAAIARRRRKLFIIAFRPRHLILPRAYIAFYYSTV